jgi:MinD-like ATPase involved in chromosome partitioning or flagellar assembly
MASPAPRRARMQVGDPTDSVEPNPEGATPTTPAAPRVSHGSTSVTTGPQPRPSGPPPEAQQVEEPVTSPPPPPASEPDQGEVREKKAPVVSRGLIVKAAVVLGLMLLAVAAMAWLPGVLKILAVLGVVVSLVFTFFPDLLDHRLPKQYEPDSPVPTRGLRGVYWKIAGKRLHARLGWHWLAQPSWHERNHNANKQIWEHRWVQKVVAVFNSKGGSAKTTVATWLSVFWSWCVKRHVVAMDVNQSPGGTAGRLGIKRDRTIQLREFLALCVAGAIKTAEKFNTLVSWHHEADVSVIASEHRSNERILWNHMKLGIEVAKGVAHGLVCDVGNVISYATDLVSFYMADTPIFAGNVNQRNSLSDMLSTMEQYCDLGFTDKVSKSIVVIVGGKLRHRRQYAEPYKKFGIPLEHVFVIPKNRYMANINTKPGEDEDDKVVSISKIPFKLRVILKEILVAVLTAEPSSDEVNEAELRKIVDNGSSHTSNLIPLPRPTPVG